MQEEETLILYSIIINYVKVNANRLKTIVHLIYKHKQYNSYENKSDLSHWIKSSIQNISIGTPICVIKYRSFRKRKLISKGVLVVVSHGSIVIYESTSQRYNIMLCVHEKDVIRDLHG